MFWNRKKGNVLLRTVAQLLFKLGRADRFTPDVYLEDGDKLADYGFDAQVLSLPGHSKGSIGILTATGELFCGDLFENTEKPSLNSIMDDLAVATASIEKLRSLPIDTVYPGHGNPFQIEEFIRNNASVLTR